MIPLAQYLDEQDGDAGFKSFAPKQAKRSAQRRSEFQAVGGERSGPEARQAFESLADAGLGRKEPTFAPEFEPGDEPDFEMDAEALFKEMESELRSRATKTEPARDARALQSELKAKASRINSSGALENARKAAYEEGRTEALAEAKAEREAAVEAALAEERRTVAERQAEAIEAARAEWAEGEATKIAEALTEQTERLSGAMRMTLASILRPLAINTRRRQSIDEIVSSIAELSFDGQAMSVKASGPSELLDPLRKALAGRAPHVRFAPSDEAEEIKIEIGQTVLQSRLGEWRNALETALS